MGRDTLSLLLRGTALFPACCIRMRRGTKMWIVAGGIAVFGAYYVYEQRRGLMNWLKWVGDCVVSHFSMRLHHTRRHLFNTRFYYHPAREIPGHSHPSAASIRNGAVFSMDNYASITGATFYTVSYSDRDRSRGQRLYYQPRDYCLEARNCDMRPTDIIRMVDVDYYVDMHYWLGLGHPVLLYTFVPTRAGGKTFDGSYSFSGNRVKYRVNGGATYEHQLWDYNHDFITVDKWTGVWVYSVDQKITTDPERRVVQLTPRCFVPKPLSWFVPRNPLRRLNVLHESDWSVLTSQDSSGTQYISIAKDASTYAVTMPRELYEAIKIRHDTSGNARNISDIERMLLKHGFEDPHIKAAILYDCISQVRIPTTAPIVTACGMASHYQTLKPLIMETGKLYARSVGPPIAPEAVFPVVSYNNDVACIEGRVEKVRNNTIPSGIYNQFAREFLEQMIPEDEVGKGVAWTVAQVIEKQSKPLQRVRSENARQWLGFAKMFVRSFQKREAYGNVTDPRNISTCPTDHVLRLSKYTYPFKYSILAKLPWYAPGLVPVEIVERLQRICDITDVLMLTDFSRLDGSVSSWMRVHLEQAAYLRWFGPDDELRRLLENDARAKAVTAHDLRYDPGSSRLSGSPLTTDGNTIMCAFVSFAAYRRAGFSPEQSIRMAALVYGDDTVVANVEPELLLSVAKDLGLTMKLDQAVRGQPVRFLGRLFCDPWTTTTSMQDPRRTLPKIHTSVTNPQEVPAKLALVWKAVGYLVTDRFTPLISTYCSTVIRCWGANQDWDLSNVPRACLADLPWFVQDIDSRNNTWPQSSADIELMFKVMADDLHVQVSELKAADDAIARAGSLEDWGVVRRSLPRFDVLVPKVRIPAVTDVATVQARLQAPEPQAPVDEDEEWREFNERFLRLRDPEAPPVVASATDGRDVPNEPIEVVHARRKRRRGRRVAAGDGGAAPLEPIT
uniref:RNA-directed RNA polymerase n=1 Tax=Bat guano associated nodavirus GF-4n TaxID=795380 RepID=D9IZ79_9VIRU|nr:putative RdRp [Bat guano associated nodavirus GF-4n]